ncbi:MAG: hypothetical protein EOP84_34610 [Verrucomicrobiaceae bacterium]|nr:MAG: hypothetical protein EOP84_34610 [Verrucomicrobiaceae bacterium]
MEQANSQQNPRPDRPPFVIRDSTVLPFGKHKGKDWKEALAEDPGWFQWAYNKKKLIDFDPVAWGHYLESRGLAKHKSKAAASAGRYRR